MSAREKYATDDNEISYEILELPKKGFLGFGAAPAKIKVTISESQDILSELNIKAGLNIGGEKKPQPQPKTGAQQSKPAQTQQPKSESQKQTPKSNQNQQQQGKTQQAQSKPAAKTQNKSEAPKPQNQPKVDSQPQKAQTPAKTEIQTPKVEKKANQNRKPQANEGNKAAPKEVREVKEKSFEPRNRDDMDQITLSQEELDYAVSFLNMVLGHMELDGVTVTPLELAERRINLDGEGSGALIGHHGETLDAIQYLTNLHVNRKAEMADADSEAGEKKYKREYVKVTVDIEGYRSRREETLRALARRMADRALKYKKNVFLEPMNPYERRIIHSEIQLIEGVSTHSVGSDDNRKIVITVNGLQQNRGYNKGGYNKSKKPPQNAVNKPVHDIAEPENTEIDFPSDDEGVSIED